MNNLLTFILPAISAATAAFCLTPLAARLAVYVGAVDMPGARKIHEAPVPRLGGLAVIAAIAIVGYASWRFGHPWSIAPELIRGVVLGVLPIVVVSLIDDVRSVKPFIKFAAHTVGAVIAVWNGVALGPDVHLFGSSYHLGVAAQVVSAGWIIGVTNAFNIIDGLDGLAAGLALIAVTSMAAVFGLVGETSMSRASLLVSGAIAGFLPYNIYPARLFLGDTGATAIGFTLAAFALKGGSTLSSGFAVLIPVFMMGLPIADTLISMLRRVINQLESKGSGMFVADANHIHHRLLALGVSHSLAVAILCGTGFLMASAALISIFLNTREAALVVIALLFAGFVGMHRLGYDEFAFLRRGTILRAYETPVVKRSMFVVFLDVAMVAVAAYLATALKSDDWSFVHQRDAVYDLAGTMAPLTVLVFWRTGMYRGSYRLAGIEDLVRAAMSVSIVTLGGVFVHALVSPTAQPWTTFFIYGLISAVFVVASRSSYVVLRNSQKRASNRGTPTLVYGAGSHGVATVRELFDHPERGLRPVGFIDDDSGQQDKLVYGLPIVGYASGLTDAVAKTGARVLIIAIRDIDDAKVERALAQCQLLGIELMRMRLDLARLLPLPTGIHTQSAENESSASVENAVSCKRSDEIQHIRGRRPEKRKRRHNQETMIALCERCGSIQVSSTDMAAWDHVLAFFIGSRPFRCGRCGWHARRPWSEADIQRAIASRRPLASSDATLGILDALNHGSDSLTQTRESNQINTILLDDGFDPAAVKSTGNSVASVRARRSEALRRGARATLTKSRLVSAVVVVVLAAFVLAIFGLALTESF